MSVVRNEPDMNMKNQINAALNDIRKQFMKASEEKDEEQIYIAFARAQYEMDTAKKMIQDHAMGIKSIPWSDYQEMIKEEFGCDWNA